MSAVADALADRYARRTQVDTGDDVFTTLQYVPTDRQREFHAATEFDVLYGGAAGGGKTKALLMDGVRHCVKNPGLRVGAFRESYRQLEQSLLTELALIGYARDVGASYNGTSHELRFANGSLMMFQYAATLKDATSYQGGQYQLLLFDERTLLSPDIPAYLESRLRSGRASIPVIGVRSGTNPGGPGHGAVKSRFIEPTDHGTKVVVDEQGRTVRFIPSKVSDNPHLNDAYTRQLDGLPEAMRKAFRDGSWDIFSGQVFTEWSHDRHIVPRFTIPAGWDRFAGIDWGFSAPWAVLWAAVDEDKRVWIYRELYDTKVGESEQAARIIAAEGDDDIIARYADDAMWTSRGEAKSVSQVYADNHCAITPAHKGERISGWQRVHSYLGDGPACLHHREQGWETCPKLHVLDGTAPNLVRTLPALPYDTVASRMEDVDTKAEDHAPDALRYLLINLASPSIDGWLFPEDDNATPKLIDPRPEWVSLHDYTTVEEGGSWDSGPTYFDANSVNLG